MGSLDPINAISLIVAFASFVGAYWERVRKTTLTSVEWLLSDRTQRARSVVGRFARRSETLNNEEKREFTDAVFSLLWSIQHADLASSFIKKTAIAPLQARLLYRQLEIIVPDLAKAMVRHGTADVDWGKSLEHTDTVLYSLPKYIQWPWYKDRQAKKFTTISEEMKNYCCHVRM